MSDGTWELPGITHWNGCGEVDSPEHAGCSLNMDSDDGEDHRVNEAQHLRAILQDLICGR